MGDYVMFPDGKMYPILRDRDEKFVERWNAEVEARRAREDGEHGHRPRETDERVVPAAGQEKAG